MPKIETLRQSERAIVTAYDDASQDVPLCPTSLENHLPSLPEEPEDERVPDQRVAIAARTAGVSRRTLHRWRQESAFQSAKADDAWAGLFSRQSARASGRSNRLWGNRRGRSDLGQAGHRSEVEIRGIELVGPVGADTFVGANSPGHFSPVHTPYGCPA